ncbi:MAG: cytochrome c3 family protein, partial [Coriobacteriales bacterium]|nr:cytochrome c3 family protein [Coriobacteriales bacterium]
METHSINSKHPQRFIILAVVCAIVTLLAACAPTTTMPATDTPSASTDGTQVVTWTPDSDCSICHANKSSSLADPAALAGFHTISAAANCATCHADTDALTTLHADANGKRPPKKLKLTGVDSQCSTCHKQADLIERTADSKMLADKDGKTINPHAVPSSDSHDKLTCNSCHVAHDARVAVTAKAEETCFNCHHQ